jgi:hypothetical protein
MHVQELMMGLSRAARVASSGVVAMALLIACGGGGAQPTPRPSDPPRPGFVTASDFDDWPFIPRSGHLVCDPSGNGDGRLLVRIDFGDSIEYALNGQARTFGFPELDTTVMPAWPDASSLGPIIARGLELCE